MSGVKLTEACMTSYTDIQKGKKHRYAIFLIKDGQIDVEKVKKKQNSFQITNMNFNLLHISTIGFSLIAFNKNRGVYSCLPPPDRAGGG